MKEKELKELKLTKNIIIPFPNFQQNTIISPTQMNDNFEEIEHAYNTLIDNHNGALEKINKVLSDLTSSDNEAIVNEQERVKAEETRVQNEEERIANEEERKTEETKRIAMYNVHLNDEIRREQKHIQMVGEFDTKVGEVDTLISTKTEEYNSFVETKTEEYNTFVETKEVEIQDAINSIPPKSELIGEKGDKGDKGEKGDKGDRGEQGLQGIQGIQGVQGLKGDKGDKGEQGIQGLKGDKGDKGDRGEQGVKGDTPSITHLETSINNKIQEVETRFNTLTSSQQQDAEVIDARDGETSLKARLDRDIEKAKQVYVNVEGSNISTDSSSGYLKDIEIKGNTIQDASNLADIRSVGDKVEGQELYEIPVLSRGKNLFDGEIELGGYDWGNGVKYTATDRIRCKNQFIPIKPNTKYVSNQSIAYVWYDNAKQFIKSDMSYTTNPIQSPKNAYYVNIVAYTTDLTINIALYESDLPVSVYEPYQEDKLTILSPTPLEKVGDVRDRIIEKDGVWGVEKNVVDKYVESTNITYCNVTLNENTVRFDTARTLITDRVSYGTGFCNKLPVIGDLTQRGIYFGDGVHFILSKTEIESQDKAGFVKWVETNNVAIKYPTTQPQFIPLPHDQQIKLRTFANKTNISFLTEIEGTIKAQVPKSLGATVNTHTEQINNLNKELDRVKKLEESTVSTVETESDFTTVEATSNGYFEDVKLEGKTLVNLVVPNYITSNGVLTQINNSSFKLVQEGSLEEVAYKTVMPLTPNKEYTIVYTVLENTLVGKNLVIKGGSSTNIVSSNTYIDNSVGTHSIKFVPNSSGGGIYVRFAITSAENDGGYVSIDKNIVILEGDHTQNPPNGYIEGLKSVGQDTDEIVVSSVKGDGNLWDGTYELGSLTTEEGVESNTGTNRKRSNFIPICGDHLYLRLSSYSDTSSQIIVHIYDTDYKLVSFIDGAKYKVINSNNVFEYTLPSNAKYLRFRTQDNATLNNDTIMISSEEIIEYTPHQSDKKRLLYYNEETQAWEKPILREWDSIEKHANGKYYYHQRSGEIVLNGSEDWNNSSVTTTNTIRFLFDLTDNKYNTTPLSDKFKGMVYVTDDIEGAMIGKSTSLTISILKSKLSSQDVTGFKQWLQTNNVTVVYQLAQEKVYECTNIDLITYANETNYIVESGAIVPKTTLKVHNNISNVVNILQEKVSLLEDKFIQGLKQVLAGDMYSLAELLYPEDFVSKEEPIDVPTLLI